MGNVGDRPYLTLHLYGSYDFEGGITNEAQLYELDEERIQFTNGGVFFGLPEDDIVRRENGIKADFPTTLLHKVELLKRLIRKNGSEKTGLYLFNSFNKMRWLSEFFIELLSRGNYLGNYRIICNL